MRIQVYHIPNVKKASKYPLSDNNNADSMTKYGVLGRLDVQIVAVHPLKGHQWGTGQKRCSARARRANAPSYSRRGDRINLGRNFTSVPNVVQLHKTWVWWRICQLHGVVDIFVVTICPLEPTSSDFADISALCIMPPFLAPAHHVIFSFSTWVSSYFHTFHR